METITAVIKHHNHVPRAASHALADLRVGVYAPRLGLRAISACSSRSESAHVEAYLPTTQHRGNSTQNKPYVLATWREPTAVRLQPAIGNKFSLVVFFVPRASSHL